MEGMYFGLFWGMMGLIFLLLLLWVAIVVIKNIIRELGGIMPQQQQQPIQQYNPYQRMREE